MDQDEQTRQIIKKGSSLKRDDQIMTFKLDYSGLKSYSSESVIKIMKEVYDELICNKTNKQHHFDIDLRDNQIGHLGIKALISQKWVIMDLLLFNNKVGLKGCQFLSQVSWNNLQKLGLQQNQIGKKGCMYLSRCSFPQLKVFFLNSNEIEDKGCQYLSKMKLKNLERITLYGNMIGFKGTSYLQKVQWSNLNTIAIYNNLIPIKGIFSLQKSHWKVTYNQFKNLV